MDILAELRANPEVVKRARVLLFVVFGCGCGIGFTVASFLAEARIETAQANSQFWRDQHEFGPKGGNVSIAPPVGALSELPPLWQIGAIVAVAFLVLLLVLLAFTYARRRPKKLLIRSGPMSNIQPSAEPLEADPMHVEPPKLMALQVDGKPNISKTKEGDGIATYECTLTIANRTMTTLKKCEVFVVSVERDGKAHAVNATINAGMNSEPFPLTRSQSKSVRLFHRNLREIAPALPPRMKTREGYVPLAVGKVQIINLELRSEYAHPTRVRLEFNIGAQDEVSGRILEQSV